MMFKATTKIAALMLFVLLGVQASQGLKKGDPVDITSNYKFRNVGGKGKKEKKITAQRDYHRVGYYYPEGPHKIVAAKNKGYVVKLNLINTTGLEKNKMIHVNHWISSKYLLGPGQRVAIFDPCFQLPEKIRVLEKGQTFEGFFEDSSAWNLDLWSNGKMVILDPSKNGVAGMNGKLTNEEGCYYVRAKVISEKIELEKELTVGGKAEIVTTKAKRIMRTSSRLTVNVLTINNKNGDVVVEDIYNREPFTLKIEDLKAKRNWVSKTRKGTTCIWVHPKNFTVCPTRRRLAESAVVNRLRHWARRF